MTRHAVFGAGLIGGYIGAVLSSKGFDVTLVVRPNLKPLREQGLVLSDYAGHHSHAFDYRCLEPAELTGQRPVDVLWLTVKCTQVAKACADMSPIVGPGTVILCCQNGLGSEHSVKARFPHNRVLRVMVPFNVIEGRPGHLHRGSEGTMAIEQDEQNQFTQAMVDACHAELLPMRSCTQMSALLWAKLQLNLSNSVNALADIPLKEMLEQRDFRIIIAALMGELLRVTRASGIRLPKLTALPARLIPWMLRLPDWLFTRLASKMLEIDPKVKLSMWWDLYYGKPTEIEHLNGAVVRAAADLGLEAPVNQRMVALVRAAERQSAEGDRPQPMSSQVLKSALNI